MFDEASILHMHTGSGKPLLIESEKAFSSRFNLKMGLLSTSCLQAAASKYRGEGEGEYEAHAKRLLFPL